MTPQYQPSFPLVRPPRLSTCFDSDYLSSLVTGVVESGRKRDQDADARERQKRYQRRSTGHARNVLGVALKARTGLERVGMRPDGTTRTCGPGVR